MTRHLEVLVVDDSAFVRKAIIRMLGADPTMRVAGQASSGEEALALLEALPRVDAITLDLEMPGMGGLATLAQLRGRGIPVIVLSGSAASGAAVTLQALDLGAVDVVAKPGGGPLAIHAAGGELVAKLRAAAGLAPVAPTTPPPRVSLPPRRPGAARPAGAPPAPVKLVVIGTSTGGPPALQGLIPLLPADFPVPVLVLQHMPPGYTQALAERLDRRSALSVAEASDGDLLEAGHVLVAPSGRQLGLRAGRKGLVVAVQDECPIPSYYRPCIDFTFQQAAEAAGAGVLAVVMTGMGSDGALGLHAVKAAGGACWAQDEASSTIYGMPRAAAETGLLDAVVPLAELAQALVRAVGRRRQACGAEEGAQP